MELLFMENDHLRNCYYYFSFKVDSYIVSFAKCVSVKAKSLIPSIFLSSEGLSFILISLPSDPALNIVLSGLVSSNYNLDYVVYLAETGM